MDQDIGRLNRLLDLWSSEVTKLPDPMKSRLMQQDPGQFAGIEGMQGYNAQNPDVLLRLLQLGSQINQKQGMGQDDMVLSLISALLGKQRR